MKTVSHAQGSASVMALGRLANDNSGGISANARKRVLITFISSACCLPVK